MNENTVNFIDVDGEKIAFMKRSGVGTGVIWLGGWRSDMTGTKAAFLDSVAVRENFPYLRFDYSGHGASSGDWKAGSISKWVNETLAVFKHADFENSVVIGSSMGAWIGLRLIEKLRDSGMAHSIKALILIAPAPDFTMDLIEPNLSEEAKTELKTKGYFTQHSPYLTEPNQWSQAFLEDGRANSVFQKPLALNCPVHIMHGTQDNDVPYSHALKLAAHLPQDCVTFSLIPNGDHRLSREQDCDFLEKTVQKLRF